MSAPVSSAETVAVAMSGGVDSSVAAALLVREGLRVVGVTLRMWSSPRRTDPEQQLDSCRSSAAADDARERFRHDVEVGRVHLVAPDLYPTDRWALAKLRYAQEAAPGSGRAADSTTRGNLQDRTEASTS